MQGSHTKQVQKYANILQILISSSKALDWSNLYHSLQSLLHATYVSYIWWWTVRDYHPADTLMKLPSACVEATVLSCRAQLFTDLNQYEQSNCKVQPLSVKSYLKDLQQATYVIWLGVWLKYCHILQENHVMCGQVAAIYLAYLGIRYPKTRCALPKTSWCAEESELHQLFENHFSHEYGLDIETVKLSRLLTFWIYWTMPSVQQDTKPE